MPQVIAPDGKPVNIPHSMNGKDLRQKLHIPSNKVITKKDSGGNETLIKNDDIYNPREGDLLDMVSTFNRGWWGQ